MNLSIYRTAACAGLLFVAALTPVPADPPIRKVTVTGDATIKVVPDEMNWSVQISINDATLAKAKDRHDAALTAALAYIKGLGDAVKDLQTDGIRFDKINDGAGFSPEQKKNPYICSTQFTFSLTNFDKYGDIADALAKFDGLQVQSIDYASSKEEEIKTDALKEALVRAHDKASELAAVAGCTIDKPVEILEGGANIGPRPMLMARSFAPMGVGTPAAVPGQIDISGTVTVTYDLSNK
jgi:uncharacterized protein YggE